VKIIKLNAIDSTNTYLKNLSKNVDLNDSTIVITDNQTSGRGQMGAVWQSSMGQSLTFSMFKRLKHLHVEEHSKIAFSVSLGVLNALKKMQVPSVAIKWPNDIMSYQQKLCGILIENQLEGNEIKSTVIGIGVNVNVVEFFGLQTATSMKLVTGNTFNLDEVFQNIVKEVNEQFQFIEKKDNTVLREKYEAALFRKNTVSGFQNLDGKIFNGMIKGVTQFGELLIETDNEILERYELKQIKMLF